MLRTLCRGLVLFVCLFAASPVWARPKLDTVWTDRGDQVVCEILQLKQGRLSVKTNDMGTLSIDWKHIKGVHSRYFYRVEPKWGGRYFGSLWLDVTSDTLHVQRVFDTVHFYRTYVVEISPIERSFWSRFNGSFSLGFSYTKANNVAQFTLSWANRYTLERDLVDLKVNGIATTVATDSTHDSLSRNESMALTYYRLFKKRLNASASAAYQRNDELGLLHRGIFSVTGGISPIKTNLQTLLLSLGAAYNSELGTADSSVEAKSIEGVIRANYSLFQYTSPKTDINAAVAYYPSFTTGGRHRMDLDFKVRHELVKDFFFEVSYYTSIDTKPATQDASKSDYGIVTSISWSY